MSIFVLFFILIFLFCLVSERVQTSIITAPMVFAIVGFLAYLVFPDIVAMEVEKETILVLGEVTLALLLFAESTHISLRKTMHQAQLPTRLLGIGMPLVIVFGTLAAVLVLTDLSLWDAAILATILAPTDASLGVAVVNSPLVPHRIRQALEIEGGLNDGFSVPFLMLFIALSQADGHIGQGTWLIYTVQQIGFGVLMGIALGWLGGWLLAQADRRGWVNNAAKQLGLLSLAILSWWLTGSIVGGNGFIAAFVSGSIVHLIYEDARLHMAEFDEAWGDLLIYFIFFIFGLIGGPYFGVIGLPVWFYALMSLTLIRILPVALAMLGTRLHAASVLFLGWFGPRGLASVVLGLVYLEEIHGFEPNPTILLGVIATVTLSILAHGLSAVPGIKSYARVIAELGPEAPENKTPNLAEAAE